MRKDTQLFTLKNNFDSLVAAVLGGIFIFILTNYHGIGISPDSVSYTGVARNIRLGRWLIDFDDNPLIIFPGGYPVFLGLSSRIFSLDVLRIAPWLNALLVGMVIYLNGCMIERFHQRSWWHKWAILSILPISYTILDVYTMLWSETLFIALGCFFLVYVKKYLSSPSFLNLLLPALFTSLACDTRIAGISLLGTGLLLIAFQYKIPILKKLLHLVVYAAVGIALLLVNLIRNQQESGTLTGVRQKSITPLLSNIQYVGETFMQWFQLPNGNHILAISFGISVILVLGIVFLYRFFVLEKQTAFETINLAFCLVYIFFIIITSTISKYEKINDRLLAPAFIPLLLGISFYISQLIRKINAKPLKIAVLIFFAALFFLLQYKQIKSAWELQVEYKENGIPGYSELGWQQSDLVQFLKSKKDFFKKGTYIYSNANEAVYYYNNNLPAQNLPEPVHDTDLQDYHNSDPNYIIWFTNEFDNPAIMRLKEIAKFRQLDTLVKLNDGIILWSSPKKK